jgi:hypothetical protein
MQRKAALFIVVCAALVAALACGPLGGGGEPTPVPPTAPPPAEEKPTPEQPPQEEPTPLPFDLTGEWMSPEWGALHFEQDGDQVTGTYEYNGGQLSGRLVGNRLDFRWWENTPLGQPYEAADPGNRGDAYFEVTGDNNLEGEWRYEGDADWIGTWTAVRQFQQ